MGILATIQTGSGLVTAIWDAIGVVVMFGAMLAIGWRCFVGQNKNIGAGVTGIIAVAVVGYLAANPQVLLDAGKTLAGIVGL